MDSFCISRLVSGRFDLDKSVCSEYLLGQEVDSCHTAVQRTFQSLSRQLSMKIVKYKDGMLIFGAKLHILWSQCI